MNKVWNVNMLLCESTDKNVSEINNVFDTLIVNRESKQGGFTILTIVNAIKNELDTFGLYYFLEYIGNERGRVLYLGESISQKTDVHQIRKYKALRRTYKLPSISQKIIKFKVENCVFPLEGEYAVKLYKYDGKEVIRQTEKYSTRDMLDRMDEDHLVSFYPFIVEYE